MRQQLTFCKTSAFLITGVTGLLITNGTACSSSSVPQLPSPPPLRRPPCTAVCVIQGWDWRGVWGRLVSCIFQRRGIKHRAFFTEKKKKKRKQNQLTLTTYGSDASYASWGDAVGTEGSLVMSVLAGCGPSALPFNRKQFPPCLSRLMPAPFPPSTPEGAKAKAPWQAPAHRYQIGDKSSPVSREGQELAAAGGIQMCEDPGLQPCPWGTQPAHPASSWKAPLNHDSMKKQAWQK